MSLRLPAAFVLGLVPIFTTNGQEKSNSDFDSILEKVKKSDPKADFTKLRLAFTETSHYKPYGDDENRSEAMKALVKKEHTKAVELAEKRMASNYVDIDAHMAAYRAYTELKNDELAKYHKYVLDGLIQSILKSGDGKTPATAFVVISTDEEYVVLKVLGVRRIRQALIGEKNEKLDRIEGTDLTTKDRVTVYFNVTRQFRWLEQQLKGGK